MSHLDKTTYQKKGIISDRTENPLLLKLPTQFGSDSGPSFRKRSLGAKFLINSWYTISTQ